MVKRIKKLYIQINSEEKGVFSRIISTRKSKEFGSEDVELLRRLLTNEKSRIIYFLKKKKPHSIYHLAKLLNRDFKSVYTDLKVLERFGLIEFESERKGRRESLTPVFLYDEIQLIIEV